MTPTNHTELLNFLISKYSLSSYCEIGVQSTKQNFDKINCKIKYGCDPEVTTGWPVFKCTSDDFFSKVQPQLVQGSQLKFDIFFLDGLHHADQVQRDFENSLACLSDNGFIVIHDCLPQHENTTHVPRDSKIWHGDVYKFIMNIGNYSGIDYVTLNMDEGCCVVWVDASKKGNGVMYGTTQYWYSSIRNEAMNIIEPDTFFK